MIEIRPDQLQIFQDRVRGAYVKRVRKYLREKRTEWVHPLTDCEIDNLVRRQVIAAESFGIASETGVVRFIEVGLILGEDFFSSGKYPEIERTLLISKLDPEEKIQRIEDIAAKAALTTKS